MHATIILTLGPSLHVESGDEAIAPVLDRLEQQLRRVDGVTLLRQLRGRLCVYVAGLDERDAIADRCAAWLGRVGVEVGRVAW